MAADTVNRSRPWLLAIAVVAVAAVAAALVAQYAFDMQPCPWCILQRLIFLIVAVLCIAGALLRGPAARVAAGLAAVFAVLGAWAALYQHVVAAKLNSCNLTLADKIINAIGVEAVAPALFQVRATCADAAVSIAGIPFEYWSLGLFVLLGLAALKVAARR
jgi:disulfide bond formation protein DsbB